MMEPSPKYRIIMYATLIMITVLLCMEMAWGCVDCDLNKKAFTEVKNDVTIYDNGTEVKEIEWHNPDGTIQKSIKVEDGSQKVLYDNVKPVKNDANQYCYIKIIIKQKANGDISKEEKLYCSDGRHGNNDTPNYWELFAKFYYNDVNTPEYCRYYSRKKHAFKSFGKVCMDKNGEWRVK